MRKVQTTSVQNLEWQQHPGNYLNSREDVLVSYFISDTPFNCASWSEHNIIAFAGPEGIYLGSDESDSLDEAMNADKEEKPKSVKPVEAAINTNELKPKTPSTAAVSSNEWARKSMENARSLLAPNSTVVSSPAISGDTIPESTERMIDAIENNDDYSMKRSKNWKFRQVRTSCLTHVIFLTNPIFPSEHTTLITSHQSRIKHVLFSPAAFGPLLLSADESGRVCIWEMKNSCTNEWISPQSFSIPHVIALYWIPLCLYSQPVNTEVEEKIPDLTKKFTTNGCAVPRVRIPAFLAICGTGVVNLVYKGTFEGRWNMITIRVQTTSQITHCDLIFIPTPSNTTGDIKQGQPEVKSAYLALAGKSLPNRIAIHRLNFDLSGPIVNQRPFLRSNLDCLISLPSQGLPQYSVVHVKFDRSLPLNNYHHRPVIVVTSNSKNCFVSKWEPVNDLSQAPTASTSYTKTAGFQAKGLPQDSSFISAVQCFSNGHTLFCYFDGTLEIRSCKNLEIIETKRYQTLAPKYRKQKEETSLAAAQNLGGVVKSEKKEETESMKYFDDNRIVGQPFPSPLSIAVSPNSTAFCLLDYNSSIHIYVRENPLFFDDSANHGYVWGRVMANLFELSFIQGISYWDLLLSFRDKCGKSSKQVLNSVIGWISSDYAHLTAEALEVYYPHFHSLCSRLLRISETQMTNYMDCQARLFVNYVHDSFYSCFNQVKASHGDFSNDPQSSFANSQALFTVMKGTEQTLYPLTEWVLYFIVFFLRNIFHFLQTDEPNEQLSITETKHLQSFFVYNAESFPNLYPCFSLLFDEYFMKQLLVLILASKAIRNQAAADNEQTAQKNVGHEINTDMIELIFVQITAAQSVINQLKSDPKGYDLKYFLTAKAMLRAKLSIATLLPQLEKIHSMSTLYQELDLDSPLIGFLEQNQIRKTNKRQLSDHFYDYTHQPVSISRKFDIISRQEIKSESLQSKSVRQCTQCNRLSVTPAKTETQNLLVRWQFCCPICSGPWKVCVPSFH